MRELTGSEKTLLLLILLAAAFLRLYKPLQYPLTINQDELNNIYDGWSFAETGKDHWQSTNPFILRGLGDADNRPALLAWVMAAVFKITGYSLPIGRLINLPFALLSLWWLFMFLKNSFNKNIAFAGVLVAALSPWHILFSRMALEGTILPSFFLILVLYLWQKCRTEKYENIIRLILLGLITGFSANAYQATKMSAPIISLVTAIDVLIVSDRKIKTVLLLGAGCLAGALPQLYSMLQTGDAFFARAKTQTIHFNSAESIWQVIKNIALNLNPVYLFFSSGVHNNTSIYRLYPAEVLFFYTGLVLITLNYKKLRGDFPLYFIAFATLAVLLPTALTYANPHAIRASGFIILAPIFTAFGWYFITGFIKNINLKKIINYTGIIVLFASCAYTVVSYHNAPQLRNRNQQHYLVQMYEKLAPIKDDYSRVYVENTTGESYLYLIAFCGIRPSQFHAMEKDYLRMDFDDFNRLDKYYFVKAENWQDTIKSIPANSLVIAQQRFEQFTVLDSSVVENSTFYFMKPSTPAQMQSD